MTDNQLIIFTIICCKIEPMFAIQAILGENITSVIIPNISVLIILLSYFNSIIFDSINELASSNNLCFHLGIF